jgi:CO/xanthine dehydrogenase FAD-binding subunit
MVKTIVAPTEPKEAAALRKSTERSFFLAGGTFLNAGRKPGELNFISLHRLGLKKIEEKDGALHTGAMVTLGELSDPPDLEKQGLGALRESCRAISRNIRNMATMGGTIAARYTRSDIAPVLLAAHASVVVMYAAGVEKTLPLEDYYEHREKGDSPLILEIIIPLPSPPPGAAW